VSVLSAWNDGPAKSAILDFVARVTEQGGPDFVPTDERIAVFDHDGTLWCEQPLQIQFFFAQDRLKELALEYPPLAERQPFKAFMEDDFRTIADYGKQDMFEVMLETHSGLSIEAFQRIVAAWLETARHRELDRPYLACVYQPQLELLDHLRANGFKTFIVSGGGIDFVRVFTQQAYGVPPEQVIASSLKVRCEIHDGRVQLIKESEIHLFNDRDVKAHQIARHIGRRPILAFGNSDGDLAMLRYVATGEGARLALLLHHDDGIREFAYDREFRLSALAEALDRAEEYGITLVGMKDDWKTIFSSTA
jgi:phosphoserine phosphatase